MPAKRWILRRPRFVSGVRAAICLCAVWAASAARADDLAERRLAIARMSPADQQELLRKQERFLALSAPEQDRLREFQAAIDAGPDAERLRKVLFGYHEWLKTLSPGERAELAEMPAAERVKRIKDIVGRQRADRLERERAEMLTSHDLRSIWKWMEDIVWKHKDDLLKSVSPQRRRWIERENEDDQRRALLMIAFQRSRDATGRGLVAIGPEDIERLSKKLSEKPKDELGKHSDIGEQRRIVGGWIASAMRERSRSGRGSRRSVTLPEANIARFFREELQARDQDELMSLPPSEAREKLHRMYWQRERGESMFRGGPGGPPDGRRRDSRPPDSDGFERRKGPPREPSDRPPRPPQPRGERDRAGDDDPSETKI